MNRKKNSGAAGSKGLFAKNKNPMNQDSQTRRFDEMRKQIELIAAKQDTTSKNVYEILDILRGDDFADGMVIVVKDHEKRLKKLETLKNKAVWTIFGMSIPGSYGIFEFLRKVFPFLVVLLLFPSCMTLKKKEDIAYRHFRENPVQLAKLASVHYPVQARQGQVVFDTLRTVLRDTIDCPDSTRIPCPPCIQEMISGFRVDTVPDLAKIAALEGDLNSLLISEATLQAENTRLKKQSKNRLLASIGLGLGLIISLYLLFKP